MALVWSKDFIRFKGERFKARAKDKGNDPVLCTPIVFDDGVKCGVGVIVDGEILRWGLFAPRDYVASWRAGEILRHFGHIDTSLLRGAYYAASRSLNDVDATSYARPIIEKIGKEEHGKIMSLPIPEKVVDVILDGRKNEGFKPNLYPLTEEVEAGTLTWRNEFSEVGVLTPGQYRTRKRMREEVEEKTSDHLHALVNVIGVEQMELGIHEVKNNLVILFEKRAHEECPVYILVALATITSNIAIANMDSFQSFKMLETVSTWVSRTSGYPRVTLFGLRSKRLGALSPQESATLLQRLTDRYFPFEKNLMGL